MPIMLLPHAKQRMRERGIGKSIVYQALMQPDNVEVDPLGGKIYTKKFGKETLRIPVNETKNDIIVKTVFFKRERK